MWAKVDDGFWCHPKVMGCSLAARGLWVSALSWSCAQRRSIVPDALVSMLGADEKTADELAHAGLWIAVTGGWEIHDWAEYQELSTSEKRAEAGRRGGRRSGEARRSKPKQTDTSASGNEVVAVKQTEASDEAGTRPVPTHPIPTQMTASIGTTTSVAGTDDPVVDDQAVNRAVREFALDAARRANADDLETYARGAGKRVTDSERDLLRETMLTGADPVAASEALRAHRGSQRAAAPTVDPEAAVKAAEAARKAEEATRATLAQIRQQPERRLSRDELRALRAEAVG